MSTKLILTHDVTNLGVAGDVVTVKDGYARNYLVPRKLATPWTKGAQRQIDQMAEARRRNAIESMEAAQTARAWLASNVVTVAAVAGANGRLFGAVSTSDLAEAVKAAGGPAIDRRKIQLTRPVKAPGRDCSPGDQRYRGSLKLVALINAAKWPLTGFGGRSFASLAHVCVGSRLRARADGGSGDDAGAGQWRACSCGR